MAPNDLIYLNAERRKRRGDKPMTGAEKLVELQWLMEGGVHQTVAARQLGSSMVGLAKLAYRHGRKDLGSWMEAEICRERWAS